MLVAFLTPILGGVLLACCFLPAPAHWLVWISLVPVAAAISKRGHAVATYLGMYGAGLAFNLITTDWVRTLEGGEGMSGPSAPDWLFQAQLLALFWPLTLLLGRLLMAQVTMPMSLALPAVWMVHELLLRNLWALVDQTGWHAYFLGYAMVDYRHISQIADLGGISGLTLVPACVSGAVWDLLSRFATRGEQRTSRRVAVASVAIASLAIVSSYVYGAWALDGTRLVDGPRVWLMPDELLEKPSQGLPWRTGTAEAPDVLLWSELAYHMPSAESSRQQPFSFTSRSGPFNHPTLSRTTRPNRRPEEELVKLCREFATPAVIGYTRVDRTGPFARRYNSAAFIDAENGLLGSYDKIGLVPWTEFTPLDGLASRKSGPQFCHGTNCPIFELRAAATKQPYRFASAICYDVAFPGLFRRYMQTPEGAPDFFLVCSSERSEKTGRMSRHVLALAKVRAIECRRTLVRNVYLGHSGRIDSTGRLLDESVPALLRSPVALGAVPVDRRSTLFVLWGDWMPWGAIAVVAVAVACKRWRSTPSAV